MHRNHDFINGGVHYLDLPQCCRRVQPMAGYFDQRNWTIRGLYYFCAHLWRTFQSNYNFGCVLKHNFQRSKLGPVATHHFGTDLWRLPRHRAVKSSSHQDGSIEGHIPLVSLVTVL